MEDHSLSGKSDWLTRTHFHSKNRRSDRITLTLPPVEGLTSITCLSSHEDMYIYFNVSRQLFLQLHLLFQPQLITTRYIQLQMIKHLHRQFVVLHTCTQISFHVQSAHFIAFNHSCRRFFVWQRKQVCVKILN